MAVLSSSITIHPLTRNGFHEVWETHTEYLAGREFDSEGIMGYLYPLGDHIVWCNELGQPRKVFGTKAECQAWLESKGRSVEWI